MDCKEYTDRKHKEWQDDMEVTVKNYTAKQLEVHIALQRERIEKNIFCRVATKAKTKKFLQMLLSEVENRKKE